MALLSTLNIAGSARISVNGIEYQKADFSETLREVYAKVEKVTADKIEISVIVSYRHADVFVGSAQFKFPVNLGSDSNFIAQAYDYLKTLPEFSDAKDC